MKKITAVLLLLAIMFSATACGKVYFDEDKYNEAQSKEAEKQSVAQSEQESAIAADKENLEGKMGKSEENKKLVVKRTYGDHMEYLELIFDKKGNIDYKITYKYFDEEDYYRTVLGYGDIGSDKMISHDDKLRMIAYKSKDLVEADYEFYYNLYARKDSEIYQIIE